MIRPTEITDLDRCAAFIRERFSAAAAEFGLTEQHLITGHSMIILK